MSDLAALTSTREGSTLAMDTTYAQYINLKSIEYIHSQFYAHRNSRDDLVDSKNAYFQDLYSIVDEIVKKAYLLFLQVQTQTQKIKTFEETMVQLDEVFTGSASGDADNGNFTVA